MSVCSPALNSHQLERQRSAQNSRTPSKGSSGSSMAVFRFSSLDRAGFSVLFLLALLYGAMSFVVYSVLHMKFIHPMGIDAPLHQFSESRAMEHVRVLSRDIEGRQLGRKGYYQAADYIMGQLQSLKERADPKFRIEVEENTVNGSFNMMFLGRSISLGYRAHTNIVMRLSSVDSLETDPSVLVNAHFDSPLGSPGAADCGSCVASSLELARLIVDSGWVPPRPVIFLYNGAEEIYMLGAHGFITTHNWRDTIGAVINIEASGSGGPDLVCQSGPGSWPSSVYAKSAIHPMATSAAQDVFNIVPGDTDYRIFSQDFGNIPGLDIIFVLGGYLYHTGHDTLERLVPGSIQARGENLISVVKSFASSSMLRNASERSSIASASSSSDEGAVYFDYLTWFMVYYPTWLSRWLHSLPIVLFFLLPILCSPTKGLHSCCTIFHGLFKGVLLHAFSIIMGIVVPVMFAVLRLAFTKHTMSWFAHPYSAFMMFVPCSLVGLLIPKVAWLRPYSPTQKGLNEGLEDEAKFWGEFGFYAIFNLAYLLSGLNGGFLTFFMSASLLVAWAVHRLFNGYGTRSIWSAVIYILPLTPWLMYSVDFGGFLVQFLIEKMGMMGSPPSLPFAYYIQDILVAAVIGLATGFSVGPVLRVVSHWLARSSIIKFLLQITVVMMALSSQLFPYDAEAPKRIVLQNTVLTSGGTKILNNTHDFAVVDSNSLSFLFKHSPKAVELLPFGPDVSFKSTREEWLALYPVNYLCSETMRFPRSKDEVLSEYKAFPHISTLNPQEISDAGSRKVHLEFDLGPIKELWVAVLNITGPLHRWSFVDTVPAPETIDGGPPSHILRLSGASHEKWIFWLEANSSEALRVDVAVLDQHLVNSTYKLKRSFPDWVDVVTYTSFMSSYVF